MVPACYGPNSTRALRCSTCKVRFSERKGTPPFDARLPADKVASVLAPVADLHEEHAAFPPGDERSPVR